MEGDGGHLRKGEILTICICGERQEAIIFQRISDLVLPCVSTFSLMFLAEGTIRYICFAKQAF